MASATSPVRSCACASSLHTGDSLTCGVHIEQRSRCGWKWWWPFHLARAQLRMRELQLHTGDSLPLQDATKQ